MRSVVQPAIPKENNLLTVMSLSVVLGMTVALGVYFAWRLHAVPPGLQQIFTVVALFVCPPFILSFVVGPAPDSGLALTLVVGTIVLANACLYAGVAAGGYFVVTTFGKRRQRS